ncbi:MAG: hypothetical protein UX13_C0012G0004 [Candidatus Woesebacteria bacterium GW2011_GWB1_45_5]|uniref:Bacterial toxin RNase RnlA/LsoA DBD domain-containing protein n=1 Tax=Candidatus Woesebacteria bacterium GW2011_GWB1_45_5 TaxID=1618581 RepID=A0A0G1QP47_9BACT|nr:MAG: hypothetical protein UX13_C0012G0004 [Candidatus Woesebacteria bacterium GW2011_GWB1_45_5]
MEPLETKIWWSYLEYDLQELLRESFLIEEILRGMGADLPGGKKEFHDYSFVIFPAAKAYEGFLKKLFLDLKFISEEDYYGKHFRIGKALNPSLPKEIKREGVYDKIVKFCSGHELADKLWDTWKLSRNLTFHWFPNEKNAVSLGGARDRVEMIIEAIDMAFKECKIK